MSLEKLIFETPQKLEYSFRIDDLSNLHSSIPEFETDVLMGVFVDVDLVLN
jgi:hypothetical protein